jgi:hypothetical protein
LEITIESHSCIYRLKSLFDQINDYKSVLPCATQGQIETKIIKMIDLDINHK